MSTNAPLAPTLLARSNKAQPLSLRFGWTARAFWPSIAIAALAIVAQSLRETAADVSWLITLCEKTVAGETPYVDFIESNPPAAFLIYMPGTLAARSVGASPEFMVALFGFLAIAASLALCSLILRQAGLASRIGPTGLAIAIAVLALSPGDSFDQREHLALILGLPLLATLAARAAGGNVDVWLCVTAGLGGALMASIKPHFALTFLAALPYVARRAGVKTLLTSVELIALALFAALGLVATIVFFPAYFDSVVPIAAAIYAPVRLPIIGLLLTPGFLCWTALGLVLLLFGRAKLGSPLVAIPALASIGQIIVFLVQGKGWSNHAYPALALMGLAVGALVAQTEARIRRALANALVIAPAAMLFAYALISRPPREADSRLESLVAGLARHPGILTIGSHIQLGFPLTRNVAGEWVGRPMALWMTGAVEHLTEKNRPDDATRFRYDAYLRLDREMLIAAIVDRKPDAILVENDAWKAWAFSHPDVAAALADYAPVGAVGEVTVYGRRLGLRPLQEAAPRRS
jgi:hypothetical protein